VPAFATRSFHRVACRQRVLTIKCSAGNFIFHHGKNLRRHIGFFRRWFVFFAVSRCPVSHLLAYFDSAHSFSYGLAGNGRQPCAYEVIPTEPMHRWKVAWESARKAVSVSCRFHDLRHTFISRLAESQASDSTVMALAGHVSRAMMERYSHIRMEAKRRAVDSLSGTDFEPGVAQNWAQFFVSEKSEAANLLKISGEPGRTRTSNPLLKRQLLYH
jgi:integrase